MKRQKHWYLSKYTSDFDNEMKKKKVEINKTELKTECQSYFECYRKHLNTDKSHKMCSKFVSSNK